jgi:hypothetical protein
MKYILTIILSITLFNLNAQYNLQLNKVKTFTGTLSQGEEHYLDTVPVGKVWKIEATGFIGGGSYNLKINGKFYYNLWDSGVTANSRASSAIKENLWLKSGDFISARNSACNGCCPYGCNQDYVISILEFNLTQ